jgi:hypothetical protein
MGWHLLKEGVSRPVSRKRGKSGFSVCVPTRPVVYLASLVSVFLVRGSIGVKKIIRGSSICKQIFKM